MTTTKPRDLADLYAERQWQAVATDHKGQAAGVVVDVTDETFAIRIESGIKVVFRHDEIVELAPPFGKGL